MLGQTVTYPLNVLRRRMQVASAPEVSGQTVWRLLTSLYLREGVANGLFKGLRLSLLVTPLQSAVGLTVNDLVRRRLGERGAERPEATGPGHSARR